MQNNIGYSATVFSCFSCILSCEAILALLKQRRFLTTRLRELAMAEVTAQDGARRLTHFSQASKTLTSDERHEMAIVCEAGKEVLRRAAEELVDVADGAPILNSKSCDGTPFTIAYRSDRKLSGGKSSRAREEGERVLG